MPDQTLTTFSGADYSRALAGEESALVSLSEQLRRAKAWADEEEERRKRKRAQLASQATASFTVHGLRERVTGPDEDTAIADGLSLNRGSESYETYVRERKGMDDFELRRANLAELGFGKPEDFEAPGDDEHHAEREAERARQEDDILAREVLYTETREPARKQRAQSRMNKQIQAEHIMKDASRVASGTASQADDSFVEHALPHIMDKFVTNDTVRSLDGEAERTHRVLEHIADHAEELEQEMSL